MMRDAHSASGSILPTAQVETTLLAVISSVILAAWFIRSRDTINVTKHSAGLPHPLEE
jgi:hypothetical protein